MRAVAVTHDAVAASGNFKSFHIANEGIGFRDQHLSQYSAGTFTGKFGQRIGPHRVE
jgi:hypothetical protein